MCSLEPPQGCVWWNSQEEVDILPEVKRILIQIASAGFAAFVGAGGYAGATTESRCFSTIHRGRGRRWELIFEEGSEEVYSVIVECDDLSICSDAANAWLSGASLNQIRQELEEWVFREVHG